jgi:hypothetical protein
MQNMKATIGFAFPHLFLWRLRRWRDWPADDSGTMIVSFPKAGRTWLRVLLSNVVAQHCTADSNRELSRWLGEDRIEAMGQVVEYSHALSERDRFGCANLAAFATGVATRRVLFLVRDPRDLVVSYYFQRTKRMSKPLRGISLSQFTRHPKLGIQRIIDFMNVWHRFIVGSDKGALISYESLHDEPVCTLQTTVRFLFGITLSEEAAKQAFEDASFERMRKMELSDQYTYMGRLRAPDKLDPESFKTRRGKIGTYADYLSADDIAFITQAIAKRLHPDFGYRLPSQAPENRFPF